MGCGVLVVVLGASYIPFSLWMRAERVGRGGEAWECGISSVGS